MIVYIASMAITFFAIAGLIFNSAVLWNDVKHLKADVQYMRERLDSIIDKGL